MHLVNNKPVPVIAPHQAGQIVTPFENENSKFNSINPVDL